MRIKIFRYFIGVNQPKVNQGPFSKRTSCCGLPPAPLHLTGFLLWPPSCSSPSHWPLSVAPLFLLSISLASFCGLPLSPLHLTGFLLWPPSCSSPSHWLLTVASLFLLSISLASCCGLPPAPLHLTGFLLLPPSFSSPSHWLLAVAYPSPKYLNCRSLMTEVLNTRKASGREGDG